MIKRIGKKTIVLTKKPRIVATSSIVGSREGKGGLARYFHKIIEDDKMCQQTYEKAERSMLTEAIDDASKALEKLDEKLDIVIGGDLLNQNITTSFAAREMQLPLIGVYSACATMVESLGVTAIMVDGGYINNGCATAISHFSSSERQYRFPLEQGTQRPPYSQWTVTGAGACIVGKTGSYPKITKITFGEVVDYGIKDVNNMGSAMAPAAMETLVNFFEDTGTTPRDYDLIVTGDLGILGSHILVDLMKDRGFPFNNNHKDCGAMIYEGMKNIYQGGSGAGCVASVFSSYFYQNLVEKKIGKMLLVATGALLSTTSSQQGESIPCIAHLIEIEC